MHVGGSRNRIVCVCAVGVVCLRCVEYWMDVFSPGFQNKLENMNSQLRLIRYEL